MVLQIDEIIVVVFLFIIIKKKMSKCHFPNKQSDSFNSVVLCRKKYLAVAEVQ